MRELESRIDQLEQKTGIVAPIYVIHDRGFSVNGKKMSKPEFVKWRKTLPEQTEIYLIEIFKNEPPKKL